MGCHSASGSPREIDRDTTPGSSICACVPFTHSTADVSSGRARSRSDPRGADTSRSDPGRTRGAQRHRSIADRPLGTGGGLAEHRQLSRGHRSVRLRDLARAQRAGYVARRPARQEPAPVAGETRTSTSDRAREEWRRWLRRARGSIPTGFSKRSTVSE